MNQIKEIPAFLWVLVLTLFLIVAWEIRPDALIQNLLLQAFGAFLAVVIPPIRNATPSPVSPGTQPADNQKTP